MSAALLVANLVTLYRIMRESKAQMRNLTKWKPSNMPAQLIWYFHHKVPLKMPLLRIICSLRKLLMGVPVSLRAANSMEVDKVRVKWPMIIKKTWWCITARITISTLSKLTISNTCSFSFSNRWTFHKMGVPISICSKRIHWTLTSFTPLIWAWVRVHKVKGSHERAATQKTWMVLNWLFKEQVAWTLGKVSPCWHLKTVRLGILPRFSIRSSEISERKRSFLSNSNWLMMERESPFNQSYIKGKLKLCSSLRTMKEGPRYLNNQAMKVCKV